MGALCGKSVNKKATVEKPRLIFVVGGPGAGKGTQCAKLVEKFQFEHLSTGDLLRAEVASGSEKGKELQKIMSEGGLVETKCLLELLEAAMQKKGWGKCQPWLIDGFPRNQENVDCFQDVLAKKITLLGVLNFELDAEVMKGRCLGRNEGRSDDNEATIQKRLNTFLNETVPVINKLKECSPVSTIDSSQSKDDVTTATIAAVNKMLGTSQLKKEALERTFVMIKPDGVQRGLMGKIIQRFEQRGFHLNALKLYSPSKDHMETHYEDLKTKAFFPGMISYMTSGPVCAMVWQGQGAVKTGRKMLGETMPADSNPGSIRGDYCISVGRNICHGSTSVETANKEIALWFKPEELCKWTSVQQEFVNASH